MAAADAVKRSPEAQTPSSPAKLRVSNLGMTFTLAGKALEVTGMALPDVSGALSAKATAAFVVAEPFPSDPRLPARAHSLPGAPVLARLYVVCAVGPPGAYRTAPTGRAGVRRRRYAPLAPRKPTWI